MSEESIVQVEQAGLGEYQGGNGQPATNTESISSTNLEKIKELLFGAQLRESEKRVLLLEQRLAKDYSELQSDISRRLSTLELSLRQDINTLNTAIATEQRQREEAVRNLTEQVQSGLNEVEKQVSQLADQTSQRQQELRQQILAQSATLEDEIRQNYQEVLAVLERKIQELQAGKADRAALASLFRELALRVNNHDIPGSP